ncbi:hypothetical protein BCF53_108138 [Reinekea marinisedimentorum]|uniref:PilZ domain-containing protein n=2 Tax=Reinekea marinisedimentorum TaxID=230495 RepID=A0A4R3I655_9GAMM|nr:hypothetical protein BCF53_108138 [Reinekea marinisedimentorum]
MSIASLRLTMPKQNLHISRDTNALYRDVLVNQVLNSADFEMNLEKVVTNLHNLNRMPINGDARLNLTASLINQYLRYIPKVRSGEVKLTPVQRKEIPELNREFAYATKLLLRDAVPHSKEEAANFVYWAISAMAEQLQDFSDQHRPQPGILWAELNRLYYYAEVRFLTDFHSNKPDNRDIESRYKQALLFQASQPEHLNESERHLVDAYLRKWAFRAQLSQQESRELNAHFFYIDLEAKSGIQTSRQLQTPGNDSSIRVLNPLPIIEQARQHMGQLRRGTAAENIGFSRKADNIDAFMTLKKALLAWKQSTSRRFERAPCATEAKTALGLQMIHQYLKTPRSVLSDLSASETINQSKTGACIKMDQSSLTKPVSVGDVIMHHQNDESKGKLAIVRWLKQVGDSITFGIEFITGNLQPVTVQVNDNVAEALLVSTSDNDSLITHRGYCTSNTPVQLKTTRHGLSLDARAQSLMQRGQHTDQIRLKRQQTA